MRGADITGSLFGRLTVLSQDDSLGRGRSRCECLCKCGQRRTVLRSNLLKGRTRSCGCLRNEKSVPAAALRNTKHGMSGGRREKPSPEYVCWLAMRRRCGSLSHLYYASYGGRGVVVCDRWLNSFENFLADMGPRPSPGHTIDRIDVNGHYEPGNCRWATRSDQQRNKRNSPLEIHERSQVAWLSSSGYSHSEVARFFGVSRSLIPFLVKEAARA